MRAIVIRESLTDGALLDGLSAREMRRFRHLLDQETPIEIMEFEVASHELLDVVEALAAALREPGFYAHIWSPKIMYICFPNAVALVPKGDGTACERAKRIGDVFGVPRSQMRFEEMFEVDHPDAIDS